MNENDSLPTPPDDPYNADQRRLWIGNIDTRITEFAVLKLLQKYGDMEEFDFLYHKAGPDKGKPRGYCFVTYRTPQDARRAEKGLNGKLALSMKLLVKPARSEKDSVPSSSQAAGGVSSSNQSSSSNSGKSSKSEKSTQSKIAAIEEQLKKLEGKETDVSAFLPAHKKKADSFPALEYMANGRDGSPVQTKDSHLKSKSSYSSQNRTYKSSQRPYDKKRR